MLPDLTGATIVFDLDGTIVDTAPDLLSATNHALGLVDLEPVTLAELHPFIGRGSKAMIEAGLRFRGRSVGEEESRRLHEAFL
ncbi:MAG TPA: HAD hydrolase-like protein, partial [Hyphomicrobiaceae bacterium]|nr:HAD hydrolase-like protein [Hyphomicrobiaceae bacterium]